MFPTIAELHVPYILTHTRANPATMQEHTHYDNLMSEILAYMQERVDTLHRMGVADVIIDPGFGFAKTLEQNYEILRKLAYLKVLGLPVLAGLSRKSMITKALDIPAEEALNGTTALHMLALVNGADILRVHDVKEAKQLVTLYKHYGI
jgi:dihydropteroate synthase